MSELLQINGNKKLIVCFGGLAMGLGGLIPFEFLNYLSTCYNGTVDLMFYVDKNQCWYQNGIHGITTNIDDTIKYFQNKILHGNYEKIIFMGVSAGGYASILFGSLCNVNHVICFMPQTNLNICIDPLIDKRAQKICFDSKYTDLKNIINTHTKYTVYADTYVTSITSPHHICQCTNIQNNPNVRLIKKNGIHMKELRDTNEIKNMLDIALA
jgi:hypothetical protein